MPPMSVCPCMMLIWRLRNGLTELPVSILSTWSSTFSFDRPQVFFLHLMDSLSVVQQFVNQFVSTLLELTWPFRCVRCERDGQEWGGLSRTSRSFPHPFCHSFYITQFTIHLIHFTLHFTDRVCALSVVIKVPLLFWSALLPGNRTRQVLK